MAGIPKFCHKLLEAAFLGNGSPGPDKAFRVPDFEMQLSYWVYVPAQYDSSVQAPLMIYQTGWGDGATNRVSEYNTPDDQHARVIMS